MQCLVNNDSEIFCSSFDERLCRIKELTWLPWIGENFVQGKVLVLGESHYGYLNNTRDEIEKNPDETMVVVGEYVKDGENAGNQYKTYEPMEAVLRTSIFGDIPRDVLWSKIAFMNLIQSCMDDNTKRPEWRFFRDGWKVVLQVINVLRPKVCICFSTDKMLNRVNFNRLDEFKEELKNELGNYSITPNEDTEERISRCIVAKPGQITIGEYGCPVIFVRRASRIKGKAIAAWAEIIKRYAFLF